MPLSASPSATFSATLSVGTSMKCWWIMASPTRIASLGRVMFAGSPARSTCPSSWLYSP